MAAPRTKSGGGDRRLAKNGGALVLAATALAGFLHLYEDGNKPFPVLGYVVYADKLAKNLPTTCYGMTKWVTTVPPVVGERWSRERCDAEYAQAIEKVQYQILACMKTTPPQPVFDMLTSHAWNLGAANTCNSGAMKAINAGDWAAGCRRLSHGDDGEMVWSSVRTGRVLPNGKPEFKFVQGLANRRAAERKVCEGAA